MSRTSDRFEHAVHSRKAGRTLRSCARGPRRFPRDAFMPVPAFDNTDRYGPANDVNLSDLGEYRPGIQAMNEEGFWHPLIEFGFAKADVRELARELGLSFHDKPSNACLSSRISHGEMITLDKLHRVEEAEEAIRNLGFRVVRVRAHEGVARIEVPKEDLPRMIEPATAAKVVRAVRDAGFVHVTIDLLGYRSGSMNEGL